MFDDYSEGGSLGLASAVQSVLFDRRNYRESDARAWLATHGFLAFGKMHPTARYLRFRQYEPLAYERYRTKTPPNYPDVKLIVRLPNAPAAPLTRRLAPRQ
jgi:hypothetical protein